MAVETMLWKVRSEKELPLETVCRDVGLSLTGYYQIETGVRSADLEVAKRIASYFGVAVEDLFVPIRFAVRKLEAG